MKQNLIFDRIDWLLSVALSLGSLALYVRTLVPWLLPGDSGEFQVLVDQVGVAHTTGYPVYILLGKLFLTLVPVGDVAYRANLYSAFAAAVTIGLLYAAGRLATDSRWAGLLASLALAVSFTFWSQALIAEVYAIGAAFLAAVIVALLAWERTGQPAALFAAGLCGGLGLGAHASVGICAPAVAVYLALHRSRWRTRWVPALTGALAGLMLYLLAFLIVDLNAAPANIFNAAYGPARSAWGLSEADLASPFRRLVFVATGRQWRTALYPDPPHMGKRIGEYLLKLPREFSGLTLLLALLGLCALTRHCRRVAVLLGVGLLSQWLFYFNYHVGDLYVFYIPGYLLLALLAGAGYAAVARWLARRLWPGPRVVRPFLLIALLATALWPVVAPHMSAVVRGETPFLTAREYPVNTTTRYLRAEMAGVVRELEAHAIVFVDWGRLYPLYYAAHLDAGRRDLQFIEAKPRSESSALADSVIEFVAARVDSRPIYSLNRLPELERAGFSFRSVTKGSLRLFRIERR